MKTLAPNIDIYGRRARLGALADYLELQAVVSGRSSSFEKLADILLDNDWANLVDEGILQGPRMRSSLGDELDRCREGAASVMSVVSERADILQDRYPFDISARGLIYRGPA